MWIKITENISLEIVRNVIIIERLSLSGKSLLWKNCKYKEYETHVMIITAVLLWENIMMCFCF